MRHPSTRNVVTMVLTGSLVFGGCASQSPIPRMRIGSLPFPGMLSLYEAADPDDLGVHCSGSTWARLGSPSEQERGTLYTRHAGFIDLCHVRESIDWTRFFHTQLRELLLAMDNSAADVPRYHFNFDEAEFEISVWRPDWWFDVSADDRDRIVAELSIRAAQRLSVAATTWHEVITWYGHQTVPGLSERGSAFTWDDSSAHVVGATVGGRALRRPDRDWDGAVTLELDQYLRELGVTGREELHEAEQLVKDRWWKGSFAIRRDLDTGLGSTSKVPWLPPRRSSEGVVLELPAIDRLDARSVLGIVVLTITPPNWMERKLWPDQSSPHPIDGEVGLVDAVERVRTDMRKELGEGFDQP